MGFIAGNIIQHWFLCKTINSNCLPYDMMRVNKRRTISAQTSPSQTKSGSSVEEPGQCDEKWATGTRWQLTSSCTVYRVYCGGKLIVINNLIDNNIEVGYLTCFSS